MLLTYDDAINSLISDGLVRTLLGVDSDNVADPILSANGCPLKATFYLSGEYTDFGLVHDIHAAGHEIAVHTVSHATSYESTREEWIEEIAGLKALASRLGHVPEDDIVGFRAPFLQYNEGSMQALHDLGMLYDGSVREYGNQWSSFFSHSPAEKIWPYTLDYGLGQAPDWVHGDATAWEMPGLWEVPMRTIDQENGNVVSVMDNTNHDQLMTSFEAAYNGNRSPVGLYLHMSRVTASATLDVLRSMAAYPDVYFLTTSQLVRYMQNPVLASEMDTLFPSCDANPIGSDREAPVCACTPAHCDVDNGYFEVCGECPTAVPRVYNWREDVCPVDQSDCDAPHCACEQDNAAGGGLGWLPTHGGHDNPPGTCADLMRYLGVDDDTGGNTDDSAQGNGETPTYVDPHCGGTPTTDHDPYSCDPNDCADGPDSCVCASASPPGGLDVADVPQFVLLSFEGGVTENTADAVADVLGVTSANGCPGKATFFVSTDNAQYDVVHSLWAAGHEVASASMTYSTHAGFSAEDWAVEVTGSRLALSKLAHIPEDQVVGFRSPFLSFSDRSLAALVDAGYKYDSSIKESGSKTTALRSFHPSRKIYPYSLEQGIGQRCEGLGYCQTWSYEGLWEVPVYTFDSVPADECSDSSAPLATVDATDIDLLKANFDAHYAGNRAPIGLQMRSPYTDAEMDAVREFAEYAAGHSHVYFVTHAQLLQWMENPVPKHQMSALFPSCNVNGVDTSAAHPVCMCEPISCPRGSSQMAVCGPHCPDAAPTPSNFEEALCDNVLQPGCQSPNCMCDTDNAAEAEPGWVVTDAGCEFLPDAFRPRGGCCVGGTSWLGDELLEEECLDSSGVWYGEMDGEFDPDCGVPGCTDIEACNYDAEATDDDGSCTYPEGFRDCDGQCVQDSDGDDACDELDGCVDDPNKTEPGFCGCGNSEDRTTYFRDSDGDGAGDAHNNVTVCDASGIPDGTVDNADDLCPDDVDKQAPGDCGCGNEDIECCGFDADGDGICDEDEVYPGCTDDGACNFDPTANFDNGDCTYPLEHRDCDGSCLHDADGDDVCDEVDACASDPDKVEPGVCGCGNTDELATWYSDAADADGAGDPAVTIQGCEFAGPPGGYVANGDDGCPSDPNKQEPGVCGCGSPDVPCCGADADSDGICDEDEIAGCTDVSACNYDALATDDDDSCVHPAPYRNCTGVCIADEDMDNICDEEEVYGACCGADATCVEHVDSDVCGGNSTWVAESGCGACPAPEEGEVFVIEVALVVDGFTAAQLRAATDAMDELVAAIAAAAGVDPSRVVVVSINDTPVRLRSLVAAAAAQVVVRVLSGAGGAETAAAASTQLMDALESESVLEGVIEGASISASASVVAADVENWNDVEEPAQEDDQDDAGSVDDGSATDDGGSVTTDDAATIDDASTADDGAATDDGSRSQSGQTDDSSRSGSVSGISGQQNGGTVIQPTGDGGEESTLLGMPTPIALSAIVAAGVLCACGGLYVTTSRRRKRRDRVEVLQRPHRGSVGDEFGSYDMSAAPPRLAVELSETRGAEPVGTPDRSLSDTGGSRAVTPAVSVSDVRPSQTVTPRAWGSGNSLGKTAKALGSSLRSLKSGGDVRAGAGSAQRKESRPLLRHGSSTGSSTGSTPGASSGRRGRSAGRRASGASSRSSSWSSDGSTTREGGRRSQAVERDVDVVDA